MSDSAMKTAREMYRNMDDSHFAALTVGEYQEYKLFYQDTKEYTEYAEKTLQSLIDQIKTSAEGPYKALAGDIAIASEFLRSTRDRAERSEKLSDRLRDVAYSRMDASQLPFMFPMSGE